MATTKICIFNPISTLIDITEGVDGVVVPSLGAASAGAPVVLNSNGLVDAALFVASVATTGFATALVTKVANYTATANDHTINCNGTFTVTLPTIGLQVGQELYIKNIAAGVITVSSSVPIDFLSTLSLSTQGQSIIVQWDGTQWWIY